MIEKKILIFGLLVLFLLPASALAADGDSSPESTIVFSETLPDDVMFYPDNETHGTGYAESFADVSDWTTSAWTFDAPTTDGDLGTVEVGYDAGSQWSQWETITPSVTGGLYAEIRFVMNSTSSVNWYLQVCDTENWGTGNTEYADSRAEQVATANVWITYKWPIELTTVEAFRFAICSYAACSIKFDVDYLRIDNSTSMGWQHDGSTTAGTDNDGDGDKTYTTSSDGNILTIGVDHSAGAGSSYSKILPDTTTTSVHIERDYYPFIEARYRMTFYDMGSSGASMSWVSDARRTQFLDFGSFTNNNTWVTERYNVLVGTHDSVANYGFYVYFNGDEGSYLLDVDWVQLYSIANFTITLNGNTINDYLYVDAGSLYSNIDSGYIELDHDPTLSVVPDTYPLYYNLITIGTVPEFSMYVSSWSTYSDETRGIISSRIVTDIKLKFDSTEIISEIKFAMDDISIFDELFLSLDMWGYLGPMAMIVIGYVLAKKEKFLGVLWFAVECLFVTQYLALVEAMPDYWWHIFILLLGGLFTCVYPLLDR